MTFSVLIGIGTICSSVMAGDRNYGFYDVGNLGCDLSTEATDINDRGFITGHSPVTGCVGANHAFVWFNGTMTDLYATYEGGEFWAGEGISRNVRIIGSGTPADAVLYDNGATYLLPTAPGCESTFTYFPDGINDAGTMGVGSCCRDLETGQEVPVVYFIDQGTALDIPPQLPDSVEGWAAAVNDSGVVVGNFELFPSPAMAFFWKGGVLTIMENTLGGESVNMYGLNNAGLAVGNAETSSGYFAASYDVNTRIMSVIGDGSANDANDRGQAVGDAITGPTSEDAVLYEDGMTINLATYLPSNYVFSDALAINNYGWIVGSAVDEQDHYYGWLLVPLYSKGDYDGDDDVDLHDAGHFMRCYAAEPYQGPEGGLHVGCSVFDFDDDVDLDLADYAAFQAAFTGPIKSGW